MSSIDSSTDEQAREGYCLVMLQGPAPGSWVPLGQGRETITLGRDELRDVPLDDPLASRLHARLWHDGRVWQLEDCGSRNGTKVNLESIERAILEPGDLISVGNCLLVFLANRSSMQGATWRRSVVAGTTGLIRMDRSERNRVALDSPDHQPSPSAPDRLLPLLYHLATMVLRQPNVRRVAQLAAGTLAEATAAGLVNVWLTGASGRLRRRARALRPQGVDSDDHLLASVSIQRDEAILVDPDDGGEFPTDRGPALCCPIPGRARARGAIECFQPPAGERFNRSDLRFVVAAAHQIGMAVEILEHREQLEQANENLRRRLHGSRRLLGKSAAMARLMEQIHRVAPTSATVLVLGESGTGKELVAQTIHELSDQAAGPFVTVNCAAFNESLLESELFGHEVGAFTGADHRRQGQFEQAHRGTIFLDEVGEMSPACQAKVLRILEGHPFERVGGSEPVRVDVRVVAATHRDLRQWIREGRFREDLYHRLRVIELRIAALRERGDDRLELASRFLEEFRRQLGRGPRRLSSDAAVAILAYAWPGNVRELRNAIERAVVLGAGDEVEVADLTLPPNDASGPNRQLVRLAEVEQDHIRFVLDACQGNKTRACEILGIQRGTLYNKLRAASR
ncbi:MAG: sigma-54-dependent Fis family transcriptional regulator [Planctomycetia bacterium]|nr:MAG: sigma-54-dependent Fis family transcriptional regulator [Planctomycetia bacterium]